MKYSAAVAITAMLIFTGPAIADGRAATEAEAAQVGEALKGAGFSSWGKVEFDDGKWEIDNAVHSDGKTYDVDLDPTKMSVLKKDLDD